VIKYEFHIKLWASQEIYPIIYNCTVEKLDGDETIRNLECSSENVLSKYPSFTVKYKRLKNKPNLCCEIVM
jgi:hypothetical protein